MAPTPYLELKDICKDFSGVRALDGANLSVAPGEIRCLVGENGSGKSTLIKIVAGVVHHDSGEIRIDGHSFSRLHPIDAIREGIQVIFQDFSLFPNLTVAENMAMNTLLAERRRLVTRRRIRDIAGEALSRLGVELDPEALVEDLPVASKQLVAIGRALLQNARLIIMDEPTAALTRPEVRRLLEIIRALKERNIATLFVSHKLDEVMDVSEQITVLRNGRVVADEPRAAFDAARLVFCMTGRRIAQARRSAVPERTDTPLLSLRHLSRKGSFRDVSFDLWPGEILGVTGLLGSGRTELALALFGMEPATEGEIRIEGREVSIRSIHDALRNGIGYVPEDRLTEGLFLSKSLADNAAAGTARDLAGRLGLLPPRAVLRFGEAWIRRLRIAAPSASVPVRNLSGGNQQRVVLARWIALAPKVLVLNGPTVGVDIGSKSEIHAILEDLAAKGMGILIMSDDIPEVLHNCNRILLMKRGRIVEEFDGAATDENELARKLAG
ncbi:sugar ABC transporter ATP-binding protein [Aminiphilus sp.]|uniref:sugar ABC transporter ATP-binding protein n=1 Tax=Aminiphilus sp. TaxID=1872488 RepID=UPI000AA7002B|nr:sugar ABC transporter ATP-binding protein [Aminiphilus sp.]